MIEKLIITPFQKFVKIESLGGILLFGATLLAIIWANSPFGYLYESLWQYKVGFTSPHFELAKPLILWINDGLMAVFFFLIGLEIKRELLIGELNSVRKATFPFLAALGGMIIPMALFFVFNGNPDTVDGWGIPMATDIAFSLAILQLLSKRVPVSLKVFLIAFAIVDDLGAVLVIAIFYSAQIKWMLLLYALLLLAVLFYLSYKQIYSKYFVLILGIVIWLLFLKSGVHPTIAGVLIAFTIPIRQKIDIQTYTSELCVMVDNIKDVSAQKKPILTTEQIEEIDNLEDWTSKVQSPLQHLEHQLHNWVAYLIMPLFALSNAGVVFSSEMSLDMALVGSIAGSLVLGKFIGISLASWLGIKLKLAELPEGVDFTGIIGVALLAGVGFTMSIFIANLAYVAHPVYVDSAKIGILIGSVFAGFAGYFVLRMKRK